MIVPSSARLSRWGARALVVATVALATPAVLQSAASAIPNVDVGTSGNVIAEEFEHRGHTGAKLRVLVPFSCTATGTDTDYGLGTMPPQWNNVVSSFKNAYSCDANHFDGTFMTGQRTGLADTTTYIGSAMDEKTSSILYS